MSTELIYLFIALISIALGVFLGIYIQKLKTKSSQSELDAENRQLNTSIASLNEKILAENAEKRKLQTEKETLGQNYVRLEGINENLQRVNTEQKQEVEKLQEKFCLLYTSPSPRDQRGSRMPSSA